MKNKILVGLLVLMLMSTFVLSGCSEATNEGEEAEEENGEISDANSGEKSDVVLSTGGTSGTYYVVAAAMASTINNHSESINVIAQPSKGSVENLNLANAGEIEMGMSNSDGVYFGANGTHIYEESGSLNISGLMSLYMSAGQMATMKDSGIETYADLEGKKVVLGPPSTTIVEMSKAILRAYGIDPEEDITPLYLSFAEGLQKLTDGEVDASFFVAGIPTSAMINATSTGEVTLVDIDQDIVDKIDSEYPYYQPFIIPAGTYNGIDKDVKTFKIMTEIFVNSDISEDVAYEFVKQALENVDEYKDAHVVIQEIKHETVANTSAELHPGAAKYYKEKGIIE